LKEGKAEAASQEKPYYMLTHAREKVNLAQKTGPIAGLP
jgi:hypothetical protein